jgi:hypothetical protein
MFTRPRAENFRRQSALDTLTPGPRKPGTDSFLKT